MSTKNPQQGLTRAAKGVIRTEQGRLIDKHPEWAIRDLSERRMVCRVVQWFGRQPEGLKDEILGDMRRVSEESTEETES